MKVIFTWKELIVMNGIVEIARFPASCNVRNELNKKRMINEVVLTVPLDHKPKPYYPRQFPSGIFDIIGIEYTNDLEYAPVKIRTTATREVFTWNLDINGNYWEPTGKIQTDSAYWIHHSDYRTTLGCIRITHSNDALRLAHIIERVLEHKDSIKLEVL